MQANNSTFPRLSDSVYLSDMRSSMDNSIPVETKTTLERFNLLFEYFLLNIKKIKSEDYNFSTMKCLYPSTRMQNFLNGQNNFRMEYQILLADSSIALMDRISDASCTLEFSMESFAFDIREHYIKRLHLMLDNDFPVSEISFPEIEVNVLEHLDSILGAEIIEKNQFLEVSTFLGTLIMTMSPEDFQLLSQCLLSSKSDQTSLYHFHLLYTSWAQEFIPYETFKTFFIRSLETYESINQSFFTNQFLERIEFDFLEKNYISKDNALSITNDLMNSHMHDGTNSIMKIVSIQKEATNKLIENNSIFKVTCQLFEDINWVMQNKFYLAIGSIALIGGLSLAKAYLSIPIVNVNLMSDLHHKRSLSMEPIAIPDFSKPNVTDLSKNIPLGNFISDYPDWVAGSVMMGLSIGLFFYVFQKNIFIKPKTFFSKKI
jgi:hypothetical protein